MCPPAAALRLNKLLRRPHNLLHLQATEDKNNAIAQAEKTATKAKLADRLINGLSGENKRWNETIAKFGVAEGTN